MGLGERPPLELSGISPSEYWRFSWRGVGSIPRVLFLIFWPWVLGAALISFGSVGFDDVFPTGESLESIFPVSCLKILGKC